MRGKFINAAAVEYMTLYAGLQQLKNFCLCLHIPSIVCNCCWPTVVLWFTWSAVLHADVVLCFTGSLSVKDTQ